MAPVQELRLAFSMHMCTRSLVKHRTFAPCDHAYDTRIKDELYNRRSLTETVTSSLKRSDSGAV